MKSLSSIPTSAQLFRAGFFPTVALIAAALLLAPTLTNAQNSHKPTRFLQPIYLRAVDRERGRCCDLGLARELPVALVQT